MGYGCGWINRNKVMADGPLCPPSKHPALNIIICRTCVDATFGVEETAWFIIPKTVPG